MSLNDSEPAGYSFESYIVPECKSSSVETAENLWITVPTDIDASLLESNSLCDDNFDVTSLCEDNFDLLENSEMSDLLSAMNAEDLDINEDIAEVAALDIMETTSILTLFCICCLEKGVPLVNLLTCSHADFLNSLMWPEIKTQDQVICYECHDKLKKIKLFKLQVEESFKLLLDRSTEDTTKCSYQRHNFKINHLVDIDIPPINFNNIESPQIILEEDNINIDDIKDREKSPPPNNSEYRKNKNIKEAMRIINSNQNSDSIKILATSLHSLSNTLLSDIYTNFNLGSQNVTNPTVIDNVNMASSATKIPILSVNPIENVTNDLLTDNPDPIENFINDLLTDNLDTIENATNDLNSDNLNCIENATNDLLTDNPNPIENFTNDLLTDNLNRIENATNYLHTDNLDNIENATNDLHSENLNSIENSTNDLLTDILNTIEDSEIINEGIDEVLTENADVVENVADEVINQPMMEEEAVDVGESNNMQTDDTTAPDNNLNTKEDSKIINEEIDEVLTENEVTVENVTNEEINKPASEKESVDVGESYNMHIDETLESYILSSQPLLGSNIKQLKLTKEELMEERGKIAISKSYLGAPYRCDSCLVGFQFKENLEDHVKRKHRLKKQNILYVDCDICHQFVENGAAEFHTFWHFTRYECVVCTERFNCYDKAARHYRKIHWRIKLSVYYKCPHCIYKTSNKVLFTVHLKENAKCKKCGMMLGCASGNRPRIHRRYCAGLSVNKSKFKPKPKAKETEPPTEPILENVQQME